MILEALLEKFLPTGIEKGWNWWRENHGLLGCSLVNRNQEGRVVFVACLCLTDEEQRYLLIRNLHRPDSFAPLGGVYKCFKEADSFLNSIDFRVHNLPGHADTQYDLRGFLPRKRMAKFVKWFQKGEDRETHSDCLCRELKEELKEAEIKISIPPLRFKKIRSVSEGPKWIGSTNYTQFRIFETYRLDEEHDPSHVFAKKLLKAAKESEQLMFANEDEIRVGRTLLRPEFNIASHANYFFTSQYAGWEASPLRKR